MTRFVLAVVAAVTLALPATAQCMGENIFNQMPEAELAALNAAADAVPYAEGNFWRATRGDQVITVVGTYHFDDPRHVATLTAIAPIIETATTVLVEAGPEEEKALLDKMARDPSVMMITNGPSLIQRLPPDLWSRLSDALAQRGIPGFMAAKLQPWYVNVLLAVPPCAMAQMADPKGLDGMVIDAALATGVPVRALEPFDTVLKVFDLMTEADQLAMIESTLAMEDQSADFSITLADAYFDGESRLLWELMREIAYKSPGYTKEQVDIEFARMEEALMVGRNRAWIPVLTAAVAEGPVLAAFGALHLPGQEGVLALLEAEGFAIEALPL
jgi:uncharacterized protein